MSNRTRNLYVWKTRTDEGAKRQVKAQLFGTRWRFASRPLASRAMEEEEWISHVPPLFEHLVDLESILFNKYQRKHTAWEHVVSLRRMIDVRTPREI